MQKSVLNKQGKFGVKILWHYTDMAIFVLRCFILTHPVHEMLLTLSLLHFITVFFIENSHHYHYFIVNFYYHNTTRTTITTEQT